MKPWVDLYRAQTAVRSISKSTYGELRKRLIALSAKGYCAASVQGRFTYQSRENLFEFSIRDGCGQAAPISLQQLADLSSAELSVMGLLDPRRNHLHQFTVMVEGKRADGSAWALAVHFEDDRITDNNKDADRKGTGAGSHAAFHCHVGPGLDVAPKVRVPLPALGPVEALEWVLSQLVPKATFEPAPWPEVQAALNP